MFTLLCNLAFVANIKQSLFNMSIIIKFALWTLSFITQRCADIYPYITVRATYKKTGRLAFVQFYRTFSERHHSVQIDSHAPGMIPEGCSGRKSEQCPKNTWTNAVQNMLWFRQDMEISSNFRGIS